VQKKEIATLTLSLEGAGYVDRQDGFGLPAPLFADDDPQKLRSHADHFVRQNVDVLVAAGGSISAKVAGDATATSGTPVVFTSVADPTSPAANMTGICARTTELDPTRLILLHELLPVEATLGVLVNSSRPQFSAQQQILDDAAAMLGVQLDYKDVVDKGHVAGNPGNINEAFTGWKQAGIKAALITANPFFNNHGPNVVNAAQARNIAAIYQWREFVDAGGLISYGPKLTDAYKLAATYVASILDGARPQDLPVALLTRFELVINLTTAKALGLTIPATLRARADDLVV
jgi:putative tryptophan/tyrosine transport system substrate-binding protein